MHGCNSRSTLLVNAEVDFMGGVVDGVFGIGVKTSPHRSAIEKAQSELSQEYDVRQERRRELEFLEKGGNPLDFKFGNADSVSVQSTSLTDQQAQQFITSEAKGSFALTASPHGDSVESSGRPGVSAACEPNTADNLLLFDAENELPEGERESMHSHKRNTVVLSEQSSQMDGTQNEKESEDSTIFLFDAENELPKGERKSMHSRKRNTVVLSEHSSQMVGTQNGKESEDSTIFRPYARRYRSKIKRDGSRSSSTDIVQGRGGHGSSLPAFGASKDVKALTSEPNNQKDKNIFSVNATKSATSNSDLASKVITSDNQLNVELDGGQAAEETTHQSKGDLCESKVNLIVSKPLIDDLPNEPAQMEAHKSSVSLAFEELNLVGGKEQVVLARLECQSGTGAAKGENETSSHHVNGFAAATRDNKHIPNEGQSNSVAIEMKDLDTESSCSKNILILDVKNDNDVCINPKNVGSNGKPLEQTSEKGESLNLVVGELAKEKNEIKAVDNAAVICDANTSINQNHLLNDSTVKVEEEIKSELQNGVSCPSNNEVMQSSYAVSEAERKVSTVQGDNSKSNIENFCASRPQGTIDNSIFEIPKMTLSGITSTANADTQNSLDNHVKVVDKAHEDSILEEARIVEAKRKRIAELSVGTVPLENGHKSHWDFVLEEMAWLANDFAQERLWKTTAAAQICRRVAFTSQLKFKEQNQYWKLKGIALTLANSVMDFWHSAEVLLNSENASVGPKTCGHVLVGSRANEVTEITTTELDMGAKEQEHTRKKNEFSIRAYALRYLKYNCSPVPSLLAEAPATPDRISDLGIMDISWDEHLTEESLFYAVHSGAMETYRRSIESYLVQTEKTESAVQEEAETSAYDDRTDSGYDDFVYDEDEGQTSTYYLHGAFEGRRSSKSNQKKRKNPMKSYPARQYKMGADLPYGNCTESSMLMGKRPASSQNGGPIPTKRVRTGSRQRVVSPFISAAGGLQAPTQTGASSGDTNSFQDDQSTLHGGSRTQNSLEVESVGDFERQLPYDCAGTPTKPKKKKKAKNLGSAYNQGWQLESPVHNEQRDYSKKRSESHHFDSNGTSGLYGQHNAKKLKIMRQQPDSAYDITPHGSIPSPVGSQMSNMSNPSKIIRLIHGSDRGRKAKTAKMSTGHPGSGSPWSLFEDQALVVLVHDMGPNWQLVSDAINSTLQFKFIFRKPKECKERHKILMDMSGDGADSADDSGSSQPYPSTLPGIPKGSARQLFQRLQGPMEEDTLKSHFEKIIFVSKKQLYRQSQDPKQNVPVHNSHVIALSQVCPNNLNGGVLTPLDLCDDTASSQDVLPFGCQSSQVSGLALLSQGDVGSMLPASGANPSLQGSSGGVLGSNLSSSSAPLNAAARDGKHGVPRTSLPADEQHRIQQYNQMLSGRNGQQSNLSLSGAVPGLDRGVRMVPAANGMRMMPGMSRSIPMSRPDFPGMASSAMLNSGSMLSSNMVGMPSPVNAHSGAGSGQGNSMLRPHDTMHMMRPGHNQEHKRQLMVPELQIQAQGKSQGNSAFNGLSSYPNHSQQQQQTPPQQSHALSKSHQANLQGSNHATGSQQQAYAMRFAKERQMQPQQLHMHQKRQQQQQQQRLAASSTLMPHAQPQSQLPLSSLQNSSHIQSQASKQPVSLPLTPSSPITPISMQNQQKHHLSPHGIGKNTQPGASGLNNQIGKQRQRQPLQQQHFQQSSRQHPQHCQQTQSQQQAKVLKGGRGLMHQNGVSMAPGNQGAETVEHMMQGQGLYSGPGLRAVQPSKPLVSSQPLNHSLPQQKLSGAAAPSTKQSQQMAPLSDNSSQGQVSTVPSGHTLSAVHQSMLPASMGSHHQHLQLQSQLHQKQANQKQLSVPKMLQQNRQVNSDPSGKSQPEPAQPDQHPRNNVSQMGTTSAMAVHQASTDLVNNTVPAVSPSVGSQWKSPEPVYEPGMPNVATQVGSIGSAPLSISASSVPGTSVRQGLGQTQLSGSLHPHGSNDGAQWSQQPQIPQSPTLPPSEQHYQPQEQLQQDQHNSARHQLPLQQQPQQQTLHLQEVQSSLYHRPHNSKLE